MSVKLYSVSCLILLAMHVITLPAHAITTFCLEDGRSVYGETGELRIFSRTTLLDIARKYDLGFNQITAANPGVDPWVPHDGARVTVPGMVILPDNPPSQGIVINLAEMRLYLFTRSFNCNCELWTCPVGTGRRGFSTKPGIYTIYRREKDPVWVPPPSVRNENPGLPGTVGPGPDNPLGRFVLRFSRESYGIHGTNRPWGIGRRVSHGCIRLYPEDIEALFSRVDIGTLVIVIYQPVKAGIASGRCWLQVHDDYLHTVPDMLAEALERVSACRDAVEREGQGQLQVDMNAVKMAVKQRGGIAVAVGEVR